MPPIVCLSLSVVEDRYVFIATGCQLCAWIGEGTLYCYRGLLRASGWRFTSPRVHWSEGSLVRISEWPYGVYTYEKLFSVSLFLRSKATLGLGVRLQLGLGLGLELEHVTFQTSDPSDQWTFGLVSSNQRQHAEPCKSARRPWKRSFPALDIASPDKLQYGLKSYIAIVNWHQSAEEIEDKSEQADKMRIALPNLLHT